MCGKTPPWHFFSGRGESSPGSRLACLSHDPFLSFQPQCHSLVSPLAVFWLHRLLVQSLVPLLSYHGTLIPRALPRAFHDDPLTVASYHFHSRRTFASEVELPQKTSLYSLTEEEQMLQEAGESQNTRLGLRRTLAAEMLNSAPVCSPVRKFAEDVVAPKVSQMDEAEKMDPTIIKALFDQGVSSPLPAATDRWQSTRR